MRNQAGSKKTFLSGEGAIDKLVDDDEIHRFHFFFQTAAGAHRNNLGDAQFLHGKDIRAVINVARRYAMADIVARQKDHFFTRQLSATEFVRGAAKRVLLCLWLCLLPNRLRRILLQVQRGRRL